MIDFLTQFLPFSDAGKRAFANLATTTKVVLTAEQRNAAAEKIILTHTAWAAAAGLVPFIRLDVLAVSALQLDMIQQLAEVYGVDFNTTKGKATIASLAGAGLAGSVTRLVRWIPIIGLPIGTLTMTVFAGSTTYALGEVFRRHFETGGNFMNFETDNISDFFKEAFEKGRNIVEKMDKKGFTSGFSENFAAKSRPTEAGHYTEVTSEEEVLERLQKLNLLRTSGAISETEFSDLKKKLIDGI
jgi:uncharacterized protein (DUF697 family)